MEIRKVLVVDDFSTMRRIIISILKQIGFKSFVEAEDGIFAWQMLQKHPDIDLIICDWNMPNMSGIDFLKKVRASEKHSHLPFLMVTAESQQENIIAAIHAKVSNYIVKPFKPELLESKLKQLQLI